MYNVDKERLTVHTWIISYLGKSSQGAELSSQVCLSRAYLKERKKSGQGTQSANNRRLWLLLWD